MGLRYPLLPYLYSQAAAITFHGSTLMRPRVMDFPNDERALAQRYESCSAPRCWCAVTATRHQGVACLYAGNSGRLVRLVDRNKSDRRRHCATGRSDFKDPAAGEGGRHYPMGSSRPACG